MGRRFFTTHPLVMDYVYNVKHGNFGLDISARCLCLSHRASPKLEFHVDGLMFQPKVQMIDILITDVLKLDPQSPLMGASSGGDARISVEKIKFQVTRLEETHINTHCHVIAIRLNSYPGKRRNVC